MERALPLLPGLDSFGRVAAGARAGPSTLALAGLPLGQLPDPPPGFFCGTPGSFDLVDRDPGLGGGDRWLCAFGALELAPGFFGGLGVQRSDDWDVLDRLGWGGLGLRIGVSKGFHRPRHHAPGPLHPQLPTPAPLARTNIELSPPDTLGARDRDDGKAVYGARMRTRARAQRGEGRSWGRSRALRYRYVESEREGLRTLP